jgi:hypothetical protein
MSTADFVPKVTRDDVIRIIRRDFAHEDEQTVVRLLDEYGTEKWQPDRDRVQLAALKLSNGDVHKLREFVKTAKSDFRDVVAPAEYPGFWKVGFVGVERMSPQQVTQLKEDDWDQYHSWFHRA